MNIGLLSGGYINKFRPKKLSVFTAIIEEHLEYVLSLLHSLENSAGNYKGENSRFEINNLKPDIEAEILNYPPENIIKTAIFITSLENIYKCANEIKSYIEDAGKYTPIGFDFFEIAVRISSIIKMKIDGFFTGDKDIDLETKIAETEQLINEAFRQLNKINGRGKAGNGRIVYYSCIIEEMRTILRNI